MRAVPVSRYVAFAAIVLLGCGADLASKWWVFGKLGMPGGPTWWIWDGVLGLQTSLNSGALFGMGPGWGWLFAALSMVAVAAILYWLFCAGAARDWLLSAALAAIAAGILGNLYDRLGLPGLLYDHDTPLHAAGERVYDVRDWILLMIGPYHWPNFNIADSLLCCGAALLVWHAFWTGRTEPSQAAK